MKISPSPLLLCLAVMTPVVAQASTRVKKPVHVAVKKVAVPKPASAAPVSLGNGIFMLGEEGTAPPPRAVAPAPILKAAVDVPTSSAVGLKMVRFCRSYLGHKLGNGQCTELAVYGLAAAGGQMFGNYQWGDIVCGYDITNGQQTIFVGPVGKVSGNPRRAKVQPGDIIQYEGATFENHFTNGFTRNSYPHHTAIIEQVSADGRVFHVLEQNVNETQIVVESTVNLNEMTTGSVRIWRPVPVR